MTHAIKAVIRFLRAALHQIRAALSRITAFRKRVRVPAWARPWLWVAKRIACLAVVAAAAVTLWVKVGDDRRFTAQQLQPAAVHQSVTETDRWLCIYRSIRAAVPEGSTVDINFPQNQVYFQRMAELTTGWAVPLRTVAGAQYRLVIYRTPGHCSGLAVAVQRP